MTFTNKEILTIKKMAKSYNVKPFDISEYHAIIDVLEILNKPVSVVNMEAVKEIIREA